MEDVYYDTYWSGGGERRWVLPECLRRPLERHIGPESRVIDLGCGDGHYYGELVAGRAKSYLGLDVSSVAVERARARGLDARVQDLGRPLAEASATRDVAICIEVIEHLFDPEPLLREVARVLAPGGVVLATVPNCVHLRLRWYALSGRFHAMGDPATFHTPWRDPHLRFFTRRSFESLLRAAGIAVVELHGLAGVQTAGLSRFWPTLFASGFLAVGRTGA
ncbi:MAG: class I SAM-dependent methyltransferase [Planctomycetes bacterium]|nr:class I SAM-dependent methyltransferase [Planctomycetota bacterium]